MSNIIAYDPHVAYVEVIRIMRDAGFYAARERDGVVVASHKNARNRDRLFLTYGSQGWLCRRGDWPAIYPVREDKAPFHPPRLSGALLLLGGTAREAARRSAQSETGPRATFLDIAVVADREFALAVR